MMPQPSDRRSEGHNWRELLLRETENVIPLHRAGGHVDKEQAAVVYQLANLPGLMDIGNQDLNSKVLRFLTEVIVASSISDDLRGAASILVRQILDRLFPLCKPCISDVMPNPAVSTYRHREPELLRDHSGEYVLIEQDRILDFFPTLLAAIEAADAKECDPDRTLIHLIGEESGGVELVTPQVMD